jgi:hypothetical protein
MQMKLGYVWVLLMLAAPMCATSEEQHQLPTSQQEVFKMWESGMPLVDAQRAEEDVRAAVTRPVALTQVEKKLHADGATRLEPLKPYAQKQLLGAMIEMKLRLNEMKESYKQALAEQKKQWEANDLSFDRQPGWESLAPKQKDQWHNYEEKLRTAMITQQNEILKTLGGSIADMTWAMEHERLAIVTPEEAAAEAKRNSERSATPQPSGD